MFKSADSISIAFFCIVVAFNFIVIQRWLLKSPRLMGWNIVFCLIITLMSIAAWVGLTEQYFIPVAPIFFFSMLGLSLWFSFSKVAGEKISATSIYWLVGFQSFRLPLELILHRWFETGTIPEAMTWTGQNLDILSGIVALVFLPFLNTHKAFVWLPQIIGIILLLNVIRVVLMSIPAPWAWDLDVPLVLVSYFPYVLIAPLCVVPALIAHVLTIRKLLSQAS